MSEEVLSESYNLGLGDWLERNASANISTKDASEMLKSHVAEHEFPIPDAMAGHDVLFRPAFEELIREKQKWDGQVNMDLTNVFPRYMFDRACVRCLTTGGRTRHAI